MPLYSKVVHRFGPSELASLLDQYPQLIAHRSSANASLLHYYCGDVYLHSNKKCILLLLGRGFDWRVKDTYGEDAREMLLSYAYPRAVSNRLSRAGYPDGTPPRTFDYTVEDLATDRDEILREMDSR